MYKVKYTVYTYRVNFHNSYNLFLKLYFNNLKKKVSIKKKKQKKLGRSLNIKGCH